MIYHGTSGPAFEVDDYLEGPAWVTESRAVAKNFAIGRHQKNPRILVYKLLRDVELLLADHVDVFSRLYEVMGGDADDVSNDTRELVEMVCDAGFDGWTIPDNYPDGDDTMLCDPPVELIAVEPL